ncbi:calcium uniporter protein 2, mitochondrial-like [Phalaenopsis equestris]|uniref:calcium uniporter protein 2, mitochondrial-like n=1 Tax=Phalaenopsis equestris TaxID=78828 RepID=UPI0009E3D0B0|nr:calcium uniporter protein 2, mitochondrial-like [Phalaenopsis equestris]
MALRRARALNFLDLAKLYPSSSHLLRSAALPDQSPSLPCRILPRRPIFRQAIPPVIRLPPPIGAELINKIRELDADRIRLNLISQPPPSDVTKMFMASLTEAVKSRLSAIPRSAISYSEFLCICREETEADEIAAAIARSLEESGAVITMGNLVFLHPGEMVRDIGRVMAPPPRANYERSMKELKEMEGKKAEIDRKPAASVRRELWCGLGFLLLQTLGFFRLTFWELSWDVMEPVCFYVTSSYFMAGYSFFLKTSKEPSFEGFFEIRFAAKQGRLLRDSNFDLRRFDELKRQVSFFPHQRVL